MYQILEKKELAPKVHYFRIFAPEIASQALPGQFVVLRIDEKGERIPLTIADTNFEEKSITLLVQEVGKTTAHLASLKKGDYISDLAGPLGVPTEIENFGCVCGVGGGFGIAALYPIAKALKKKGNKVISIIGARSKNLLIMEEEMKNVSDILYITTDDGTYGEKGFVSDVLKRLLQQKESIDRVIAIGPVPMMKVVSDITKEYGIKTIVSLNPIMVDGTGMCGACRVRIGDQTKFACVHGPDFDAHLVDFELLTKRLRTYKEQEKISYEKFLKEREK